MKIQIGEYDSDEGELWDDDDDDEDDLSDDGNASDAGSWETESEHSVKASSLVADSSMNAEAASSPAAEDGIAMRSRLAASIERARIAMTKLENIFNDGLKNGSSNSNLVIKQLLDVYKNCKCLDVFMNTHFFDESHFDDLLSRVKDRSLKGSSSTNQLVQDQMQRLFNEEHHDEEASGSADSGEELNAICARLCSLMKAQLVKSHDEVMERYIN